MAAASGTIALTKCSPLGQVRAAAGRAANLVLGICELTRFGRDQSEITQRIDTAAPIAYLLGQLHGPPEGGLGLVDAAREVQRGSIDAAGGRPGLQCVVEVEGNRAASRLERRGDVTRLERVDLTQGDELQRRGCHDRRCRPRTRLRPPQSTCARHRTGQHSTRSRPGPRSAADPVERSRREADRASRRRSTGRRR